MSTITCKPVLKWVGGKTQILEHIISNIPNKMNNYREIFVGGGSVLFEVINKSNIGSIVIENDIYAYDINEPLIYVYKNIQVNCKELYAEIHKLITEFKNINSSEFINRNPNNISEALENKENYYYWIRKLYNNLSRDEKLSIAGSAMFIFLNKTCFRGLFRESKNGFNVPYGHYNNPEIVNKQNIFAVSELIKNVKFICADFSKSIQESTKNDFIYLDPPYAPLDKNSFVKYTKDGFGLDKHTELFKLIHKLSKDNISMTMSNSYSELVLQEFSLKQHLLYYIQKIEVKRAINSKKPNSKCNEVIIINWIDKKLDSINLNK